MSLSSAALTADAPEATATQGAAQGAASGVGGDARQFVIFHIENEMFAVPLAEVQEIIRMPGVVRMPLSPRALEGLANLRGSVLPVVNLRRIFGFGEARHDDATRVVVLDHGRPIGLVVDRMANVVTVEKEAIEASETIGATVDTRLLTGMIKAANGSAMIMILDAAKVVGREFGGMERVAADGASRAISLANDARTSSAAGTEDAAETQLVSFEVHGQEYAFPIEEVQEIVQLPDRIAHLPNTPPHVLGVITLRNRLLPLVSLRDMFGLPAAELTEANKVVVVSLGDDGDTAVGVVMDSIREVLRVPRAAIDPMPPLLTRGRSMDDVQAICRLDDGARLVAILSADKMFAAGEMRKLIADTARESEAMEDQPDAAQAEAGDDEEQFVVFRLVDEEYGIPIGTVQEIVRVPAELTRVPNTPAFIEGVINLRGSVLPVVDQRRRFGLPGIERNDRQRIMVFTIGGVRTGFIVDSVSEVMRIPARYINGAPKLSDEQQKLIRQVANLEERQRMILLLNVDQLLNVRELDVLKADENAG